MLTTTSTPATTDIATPSRGFPWRHFALLMLVGSILPAWLMATRPPLYNTDSFWMTGHNWSPFVSPHFPPVYPLFTRSINYLTMALTHAEDLHRGLAFNLNDAGTYAISFAQHGLFVFSLVIFALTVAQTLPRRLLVMAIMSANPMTLLSCHNVMTEGLLCSLMMLQLTLAWRIVREPGLGSWRDHAWTFVVLFLMIGVRHPAAIYAGLLPGLCLLQWFGQRSRLMAAKFGVTLVCGVAAIAGASLGSRVFCTKMNRESYVSVWGRSACYRILAPEWNKQTAERREEFLQAASSRLSNPTDASTLRAIVENNEPWVGTWNAVRKSLNERGIQHPSNAEVDRTLNEVCRAALSCVDPLVVETGVRDFRIYMTGVRMGDIVNYPFYQTGVPVNAKWVQSDASMVKMCAHLMQSDPAIDLAPYGDMNAPLPRLLKWMVPLTNLEYLAALSVLAAMGWFCRRLDGAAALFVLACVLLTVVNFALMSFASIYMWRYALVGTFTFYPLFGLIVGQMHRVATPPQGERGA